MRLAVLYSGGKDSNFALYKASIEHEIKCLITIKSINPDSYMFQTPGVDFTKMQSIALEIPLIEQETKGEKELELIDLKTAIKKAIKQYKIEGIVTGAINSTYQASRIQKICDELNIWCFNPLWQKDQIELLHELVNNGFKVMIIGIASYPLDETYLGKIIDEEIISKLIEMKNKYHINPAGEGGELETFVLDSTLFKKKIEIIDFEKKMTGINSGSLFIKKIKFIEK